MKSDELIQLETQTKLLTEIHKNIFNIRFDVQNAIIRAEKKPEPKLLMGWYYIP